MRRLAIAVFVVLLGGCASTQAPKPMTTSNDGNQVSQPSLGNFSVSLAVRDLTASRAFYEKLGFRAIGGDAARHWLIMQNNTSTIGLFQGMFERNTLTFNPGWNRNAEALPNFEDVREIQRVLRSRGLTVTTAADESTTGPASLMLFDPDGNPILIDQHVPRPAR